MSKWLLEQGFVDKVNETYSRIVEHENGEPLSEKREYAKGDTKMIFGTRYSWDGNAWVKGGSSDKKAAPEPKATASALAQAVANPPEASVKVAEKAVPEAVAKALMQSQSLPRKMLSGVVMGVGATLGALIAGGGVAAAVALLVPWDDIGDAVVRSVTGTARRALISSVVGGQSLASAYRAESRELVESKASVGDMQAAVSSSLASSVLYLAAMGSKYAEKQGWSPEDMKDEEKKAKMKAFFKKNREKTLERIEGLSRKQAAKAVSQ